MGNLNFQIMNFIEMMIEYRKTGNKRLLVNSEYNEVREEDKIEMRRLAYNNYNPQKRT